MKLTIKLASVLFSLWLGGLPVLPAAAPTDAPPQPATAQPTAPATAALRAAIDRGAAFLLQNQNSNGWWSTPEQPAVTALVLTALNLEPSGRFQRSRPSELARAYDFILPMNSPISRWSAGMNGSRFIGPATRPRALGLLTSAKPDGSIQRGGLANYNTSLCLIALVSAFDTNFMPVILAARRYIARTQIDFGAPGTNDTPFDGGIGYGSKYQHSDMNNTLTAIEAMRMSEAALSKDRPPSLTPEADVNWAAVASFLQHCQNLPSHNSNDWVSTEAKDRGGFVYYPGNSMAGSVTNAATGRVALRSYGSMSYGGLLSYIYAQVDQTDPRVTAVLNWLRGNYTLAENPGMEQQGYFYYLHLMTKALAAANLDKLKVADGGEVDWRAEVAARLLKLQKPDGSWVNPESRWWESDPVLVTSYAMMTLEILHGYSRP